MNSRQQPSLVRKVLGSIGAMGLAAWIFASCQAILPLQQRAIEPPSSPAPTVTQYEGRAKSTLPAPSVTRKPVSLAFDGSSAFEHLLAQLEFGPRWPGSPGHAAVGDYIVQQLTALGWQVEEQVFDYRTIQARNIIGRANLGTGSVIILGAHYDTRKIADRSPGSTEPVPGAVDGASGVAVLLELARTLDLEQINHEIWLAFFDVEDNGSGGIPGFDWIVGSSYLAQNLQVRPEAMILVDMVGDADQQIFYEGYSDPELRQELWLLAAELGYADYFIPEVRHTILDDHVPFLQQGIRAVDIIDIDYPFWHTVEDTADKASPESLYRVGRTLEVWLESRLDG